VTACALGSVPDLARTGTLTTPACKHYWAYVAVRGVAADYRQQLGSVIPETALPSVDQLLEVPYVLVGTLEEVADQLRRNERQWGITRYTVRADALDAAAGLIERVRA
jgi:hypothetical protein